ncbi:hypothetical protein Q7P35_001867 [Cladosporium inversicolor]
MPRLQLTPSLTLVTPALPVAFDREGVELIQEIGQNRTGVGRLSIVNVDGQVVYASVPSDSGSASGHRVALLGLKVPVRSLSPFLSFESAGGRCVSQRSRGTSSSVG